MSELARFDQFIFSDGKILSILCDYSINTIELRLEVRKYDRKKIVPCIVTLRFLKVRELDILEDFGTSGTYSDIILTHLTDTEVYASFDPFSNSGEPNENDNLVIKAATCVIEEVE